MPWIPLTEAASKYNLHPLTLMRWIEKDDICGTMIGNIWFIDEATIQDFISEQNPMSLSCKKRLCQTIQILKDQISKEMKKDKQTLCTLRSLDICSCIFEDMIKEMSELIDDHQMRDIFYSISSGVCEKTVANKWNISQKQTSSLYKKAVLYIHDNWKTLTSCKKELQQLTIQCHNYEFALQHQYLDDDSPMMCSRIQDIPHDETQLLLTSIEKLDIEIKTVRILRKNNMYLLEDLLRFIKKNGFDALGKLQGIGPNSCKKLLEKLIEIQIMEGKDNCYLFQYLVV